MLTQEQNERLTRVGLGTPMGDLLRRYWYPVATDQQLGENPVKSVRLLGENLTLFRDRQGRLGLVQQRCAHRSVDLKHGIPTDEGLRCPYHGWMYDASGQCLEQPAEDPAHNFAARVQIAAYDVQELGGLIWAYIGPQPAPLLPRWDIFVVENVFRQVGTTTVPCNWLQCQENAVDTVHVEWMHGAFGAYALERKGITDEAAFNQTRNFLRHHIKIGFERNVFGIQKYRLREGEDEATAASWLEGHPLVFPNYVLIGGPGREELQMRVPIDDTTTWHLAYQIYHPVDGVSLPPLGEIETFDVPLEDYPEYVLGQDVLAWPAQGPITDRTVEKLAETDRGLIMFRKMLEEQIQVVADGGDPINTFRPPTANVCIELPMEHYPALSAYRMGTARLGRGPNNPVERYMDLLTGAAAR
ncbi:MAG: Rieske 2Fe-2S domain-containing protein [Chloroflexi bacterium]|nr:Rieske 2Fe-2S domain-containing protein [Chloroflexota bacterium]